MTGRSPHFAGHEAPRGQRHSPHNTHQDHPPSSTLMLRGLARSVDDEMILRALQSFQPLQARTIYDKVTGEPRGFAFVDFDSVESATEAIRSFESRPLVLQHREVSASYTDGFRPRSQDDSSRARGGSWGVRHNDQGERWQPRPDWICDECNVTNFARRTSCFQCNAARTVNTKEVPVTAVFRQENTQHTSVAPREDETTARSVPPSHVLVVRKLPPDMEEGALHVVFAEFDGVQDIRLIRDRVTNLSRGFGFIEFRDVEAATNALNNCHSLVVQNTHVEVSYARDTLTSRPQYVDLPEGPRAGSSMAVTALEQAQWSISQGRGAEVPTSDQVNDFSIAEKDETRPEQNIVAADVNALLDCAAAAVAPHFEEPKKMWPLPFETAGGSYVYVSEYGLYWDPDSLFYYDAHTKVYHNSFTGAYYRCVNPGASGADAFQAFVPPVPVNNEVYDEEATMKTPAARKSALSLSLKKDKKKSPGISFSIKTTAFAPAAPTPETASKEKPVGSGVPAPAASVSVGMKRKSANDIAKWSQRQREANMEDASPTPDQQLASQEAVKASQETISSASTADSVIDALTNVPQEVPICLLCRRKFGSLEMLRKHEKLSKLHLSNLAKAKENKQHIAAQYREHEKEMERDAKKQRKQELSSTVRAPDSNRQSELGPANPEPVASSLESGIGGKMLKMMGWKSGEGLGKHGTGITAPIKAAGQGGRSDTAGLGSTAPLSTSVDLSDATTDKERRQRLARARYDASKA